MSAAREELRGAVTSALLRGHATRPRVADAKSRSAKGAKGSRHLKSGRFGGRQDEIHHRHPRRSAYFPQNYKMSIGSREMQTDAERWSSADLDVFPLGEDWPDLQDDSSGIEALNEYFLGFWKAPHAVTALKHLEKLETQRIVKSLQQKYGRWFPPPEVAEALNSNPKPAIASELLNTKEGRNLKFILKILGCPLNENKAYKQFLKANTLRQKMRWLHTYERRGNGEDDYREPMSLPRLRKLYQLFPNRFTEEGNFMYFNNKVLNCDEDKNLFYIGKDREVG